VKQFGQQFDPDSIDGRKAARALPIPNVSDLPDIKRCLCGIAVDRGSAGKFFDTDRKNKDGFKTRCRECRHKHRLEVAASERDRRSGRIEKMMEKLLGSAQFGGSEVPHIAEIFSKIVGLFGGANGLAMAAAQTYLQAPPGSSIRQKIISQLLTLGNQVTQTGAAKVPDELLSEEELEAKVKRITGSKRTVVEVEASDIEDETEDSTAGFTDDQEKAN
jgi:hypothetical protein